MAISLDARCPVKKSSDREPVGRQVNRDLRGGKQAGWRQSAKDEVRRGDDAQRWDLDCSAPGR